MVCTVCGNERPERGTCRECGSKLCSVCRVPIPGETKSCRCNPCNTQSQKDYRAAHPDYYKSLRLKNPEKYNGYSRRYFETHPEKQKERDRRRYESNPDREKERSRKWRESDIEKARKCSRDWQARNAVRSRESRRRWQQAHPEKCREYVARRRALKLGCAVGPLDIAAVVEASGGICAICRAFVPEELRHIDHIVPLSKGGPHAQDNLQLLCYYCNSSKGAKMPDDVAAPDWVKASPPEQSHLFNPDWK